MDYRPLPLESFPEKLRRNVDLKSPPPMRVMAARGMLPAAPAEMVTVLYQLSFDKDPAVGGQAKKTLEGLPENIVLTAAASDMNAMVLDFLSTVRPKDLKIIEAIITNNATDNTTIARLAREVPERLTEVLAVNEVRLLGYPQIIEGLYMNPEARMSTVDRLVDLAARNNVRFSNPALQALIDDPSYNTTEAAAEAIAKEFDGEGDDQFKAVLDEATKDEVQEQDDIEEELEKPDERKETTPEDTTDEPERKTHLAAAILHMTISEKMRMAMLGSKSEREFLIKDNNRLVHMAAVTSPKVQLKDIKAWSGNRIMPESVLSYIATHRRYRRVYQIVVNLVNNPKTPVKESLRLFPQLVAKDLNALMKNRNVPHHVRRQAKTLVEERYRRQRGKR